MFNLEWLSRGRREGDLFRLINYQFKSAEVRVKRVVLTIPNIPPSPRIKEKCKHVLNYRRYSQYFKSAQSSLKLKLRTLNTYPTFCFQYPRGSTRQKKVFTSEKSSTPTGTVCETIIAAVFGDTNMVDLTSCQKALYGCPHSCEQKHFLQPCGESCLYEIVHPRLSIPRMR